MTSKRKAKPLPNRCQLLLLRKKAESEIAEFRRFEQLVRESRQKTTAAACGKAVNTGR
ncbi:MAG TPA: hypothetical protein VMR62_20215 [Bryobacteraceae bacterium]|nr:hypothetical protein [Bryobacteraceae bacterium]